VSADGRIWCWGRSVEGQLGRGHANSASDVAAISTPAGAPVFASISVGDAHSCGRSSPGEIWCWGDNSDGQLGDGSKINRSAPVQVIGLSGVPITLTAGSNHTCVLLNSANAQCWGDNSYGQLGNNTTTDSTAPVTVKTSTASLTGVVDVEAGFVHSCARRASDVQCWGRNATGQLGNSTQSDSLTAVPVSGITSVAELALGVGFTCALLGTGGEKCWGDNAFGQLGDGTTTNRTTPVSVLSVSNAIELSAMGLASCVRESGGAVRCFGFNLLGQLGNGNTTSSSQAVTVTGGLSATSIGGGSSTQCAVTGDALVCWGGNSDGQLGDGTTTNRSTPVSVVLP